MVESIESEQQVYETTCEGEQSIGPVYCAPSSDEKKIYEEFEGKRFCKLCCEEFVWVYCTLTANVFNLW